MRCLPLPHFHLCRLDLLRGLGDLASLAAREPCQERRCQTCTVDALKCAPQMCAINAVDALTCPPQMRAITAINTLMCAPQTCDVDTLRLDALITHPSNTRY